MGVDSDMDDSFCDGCKRILAIDVHGDLEGVAKKEILAELNSGYPDKLIAENAKEMAV